MPRGHVLLGHMPALRRDPLAMLEDGWRECGDVLQYRFGPIWPYLVVHPDHVRHVLQERHTNYVKPPITNNMFRRALGDGLMTNEGDAWLRQRRLMQPVFLRQRLVGLGTMMIEAVGALVERWRAPAERGDPIEVLGEMSRLTLAIAGRTLLNAEVGRDAEVIARSVNETIDYVKRNLESYIKWPPWAPLPGNRRYLAARRALDTIIYRLIDERRRDGEDAGDLLSMLLAARDEVTGRGMSKQQLRDEMVTLLIAGHESSADVLAWAWYLLDRHPDVAERLRAELDAELGGRAPSLDDLPRLRYTTMVLQETMRLYPPAWLLTRMSLGDDEIGGYPIRRRSVVILSPYLTHRHPDFWEDPERFDPERFRPERAEKRPRFAYFPFIGGPRQCIGNTFAMMEMQIVLATVAQAYRLELVPDHPVVPLPTVTLRPRHGLRMYVRPR